MTVPAPRETVADPQGPSPVLRFACPSCGRNYATKPELAGKKIRCSGCGAGVRVPGGETAKVAQPARSALKTFGEVGATSSPARSDRARTPISRADDANGAIPLLDALSTVDEAKHPRRAESILPSRSQAMEQVRQKVTEEKAIEAEKQQVKAKKKKRKKQTGFFDPKETLKLVGGVLAFVVVLALLAWGVPDIRFPLGGILCLTGFVVYLLGITSLKQLVAEEGAFKALMFRFLPPYQWWYVATHWAETKDFVAFFAAGLMILGVGGAVIKTSDIGKQAAKADQAYKKATEGSQTPIVPGSPDEIDQDDE